MELYAEDIAYKDLTDLAKRYQQDIIVVEYLIYMDVSKESFWDAPLLRTAT